MKISISENNISSNDLLLFKQVENELKEAIRNLLSSHKIDLLVKLDFELLPLSDSKIQYKHNASFSIEKSLFVQQKIKEFIDNNNELKICLKERSLCVSTDYKMNESKSQNSEKKESNDLMFIPQNPRFNFSQIILPENVKKEIFNALKTIECTDLVYNQWGFSECDPIPRSVINFYGEPGTGKTMCAHAIADRMGKKLLALNYAEIESKYVGEAPKNLQKAFDIAKQTDSVLFFDEADSFLGKRIQNVTQGAEQALNSLRSQMLILLEDYAGMVIFATNLITNFDQAFESRILKHIRFELPNKDARIAIIKKMIPTKLPLAKPFSDETFEHASEILEGFSGREIKTAILDMILAKANPNNPNVTFSEEELISSFEKKKKEKEALKEEHQKQLKSKILNKLQEKNEEAKMTKEYEEQNKDKNEDIKEESTKIDESEKF